MTNYPALWAAGWYAWSPYSASRGSFHSSSAAQYADLLAFRCTFSLILQAGLEYHRAL